MKNTSKFQNVVIATIVGWLVLFVFLPNLMIIATSFLTRDDTNFVSLVFTLDNYARLLVDASPQCFVVVVGTKADLLAPDSRPVSADEARAYAESKHAPYYETSAKDNVNVAEVFEHIATTCLAAKIAAEAAGAPGAQGERAAAPAAAQPDGEKQLCRCRVM